MSSLNNTKIMEPIAVVGMACRFPGEATDVERFWDLLTKARETWSKVPKDRFNQEAFYHPETSNQGTFHTTGGHFLVDDVSRFDAPFFNVGPAEAKAMDPQLRLLLEVAYEAFENGGLTLERLKGSDTSVYTAMYNRDYEKMLLRDPENLPFYTVTGNGEAMFSNRLSYFFDLHGPSFSLDTGCSGSLVALQNACDSIWHGGCRQSVVGGSNIILDPAPMVAPSFLKFYSAEGRCHAFDHKASGYGRGEGAACVVLKGLSHALADGDPIRAVIRSSALNQDGRIQGITAPSAQAQEELIRKTYARAHLDLAKTVYVEAHGSGTPLGDLTESSVLGTVFGSQRQHGSSILIGSVKTNIGHLENVSGLAALVKAVLIIERGTIPPNLYFDKPNHDMRLAEQNIEVASKTFLLPNTGPRQISLNSFGYGGTNTHVVLDTVRDDEKPNYLGHQTNVTVPTNGEGSMDRKVDGDHSKPYLFVLSARSQPSGKQMADRLQAYLEKQQGSDRKDFLPSLAHTLCDRRSVFSWRSAVVADSLSSLCTADSTWTFSHSPKSPKIGFVFTGQGSHWYAMGRELLKTSSVFCDSILAAETSLLSLGADWKLSEELRRSPETCRLDSALIAQPACTAIQLSIVNLLESWGVKPSAVTGHSSGEIAAAYACKAISFEDALQAAFYRGCVGSKLAADSSLRGAMLAAGLAESTAAQYLSRLSASSGLVRVACVNSPKSVTFSGDEPAIQELHALLEADGVFVRRLPVDVAYHSHHMLAVAEEYMKSLANLAPPLRNSNISFFSSVEGKRVDSGSLDAGYWVNNLTNPVLFSNSFQELCQSLAGTDKDIAVIIEIGPHSGLKGPIKQSLAEAPFQKADFQYSSALIRNEPATKTTMALAAELFRRGCDINLRAVNFAWHFEKTPPCLVGLPPYPWDHSTSHWHESRLSRNYRKRQHPPHELLGVLMPDSTILEPRWRKYVRTSGMPWLSGHVIEGRMIFPGAGFMCMAFEAGSWYASQTAAGDNLNVGGITLSQITFSQPLIVPASDEGVEMMFTLRPSTEQSGRDLARRHEFVVYSFPDGEGAIEHCRGFMTILSRDTTKSSTLSLTPREEQLSSIDPKEMYENIKNLGIQYTGPFRGISKVSSGSGHSLLTVDALDCLTQSLCLHPSTLDACIQSIFPAIMSKEPLHRPIMPTGVKEVTLWAGDHGKPGAKDMYDVVCQVDRSGKRNYTACIDAALGKSENGNDCVVSIDSLQATIMEGKPHSRSSENGETCQKVIMALDPDFLDADQTSEICKAPLHSESIAYQLSLFARACRHLGKVALSQMIETDKQGMPKFRLQYLRWIETQVAQHQEEGTDVNNMLREVEGSGPEGQMICRIGHNLPAILRGQEEPLSFMMEDGLLHRLYRHDESMQRCAIQAAEHARVLGLKNPNMRILEIGGGTGGATLPVLQALSSNGKRLFQHYTFTDISAGFFPKAEETFADWKGHITFRTLNIEDAPEDQGFSLGDYDLVIAANVLHATTYIDRTMKNVRSLLKAGARLHLLESTRPTVHRSFVFGTLPGWWLGATERRTDSPLLNVGEWTEVLRETGFSGIDACMHSYDTPEEQTDSLMITSALPLEQPSTAHGMCIVLSRQQMAGSDGGFGCAMAEKLAQSLDIEKERIVSLGDANIKDQTCICLAGLTVAVLSEPDEGEFDALKQTFLLPKELIWMTRGATSDCSNPKSSLVSGLTRVLRHENPNVNIITVDLDPNESLTHHTLADSILRFIHKRLSETTVTGDSEWTERGEKWFVPRLVENESATRFISSQSKSSSGLPVELQSFHQADRSLRLAVGQSGTLQDVCFEDNTTLQGPLADDEVEIEVKATALNFRDAMILLGQMDSELLGECSGVVSRVGREHQHKFSEGDSVYTWLVPAHAGRVRAKGFLTDHIPAALSFKEATTLPIVYGTAYYSLVTIAALRPGETVLIHAGAGGVGQAAITLSMHIGAIPLVTVGSEEKKQLLMERYGISSSHIFSSRTTEFAAGIKELTKGVGVNVVLNSLAGPFFQASLDVLARFGRFVEIGKSDALASSRMAMAIFERCVSISSVDLTKLASYKPDDAADLYSKVHELVHNGIFLPPSPLHFYPVSRIEEALRQFQNRASGKTVITYGADDEVKVIPHQPEPPRFRPDGTYVIVGGQGGLGRAICLWMAQFGARSLVVLSPSGPNKSSTQHLIQELAEVGVQLQAISCDVGNSSQLESAFAVCNEELPPVRGVIQAALVLKDTVFENMTRSQYAQVLAPKLTGTYLLHEILKKHEPLDFFIILSSYAGLIGNTGQANYAAASTFQDAFARWRTGQGYPTHSINLGVIQGAGYLHKNPEALEHLRRSRLEPIPVHLFLALLGYAVSSSSNSIEQHVDACQLAQGGVSDLQGVTDPRFSRLQLRANSSSSSNCNLPDQAHESEEHSKSSPEEMLHEAIATAASPGAQEVSEKIEAAISRYISDVVGIPLEDVDPLRSITAHGGDSLIAVEFRNWLRKSLGGHFGMGKNVAQISPRKLGLLAAEGLRKDRD